MAGQYGGPKSGFKLMNQNALSMNSLMKADDQSEKNIKTGIILDRFKGVPCLTLAVLALARSRHERMDMIEMWN